MRRAPWVRIRIVAGVVVLLLALANLVRVFLTPDPMFDPFTISTEVALVGVDLVLLAFAFRAPRFRCQTAVHPREEDS